MAYHDDLLQQAIELVHHQASPGGPKQANLRRAVSTAYYALFHLLISETISNWSHAGSRGALGRMFDHEPMKRASTRLSDPKLFPFDGENPVVVQNLKQVAQAFVQLQDRRQIADYDNTKFWTFTEALTEVKTVANAFTIWRQIRAENIAQDYLVSLLIRSRR
jgi:uncharacterized protein (UPF0332 family)